ncbi:MULTISPECIES: potassium-transporting ATPase subunit KdpC [unclassified Romboutsia]|uniref:potassium-transporting ATPase subunit KdpC n=1 Tax=unclassified Romboutsia TaxID=2626894 RepID=UPI001897DA1F|nr:MULTISPECIES: potassium-transporting ATPase subunit KdpC [unclassified Romboutsia]MDB8805669.1 potassium-transporting ATPase subunit KdpC [Romboutsia sp. 1001216sp1]MDB8807521.1 potassium-transporting ATPase subunit KdpC [Romboutsia sp. 1001216sp1]MDB8811144.1 potassium-transporting ATPase subunit KdpC [Romboutsia sp. 1001216sp1]MDB8816864.1 potassium-transporting ATPase subunit KdpC [Romboutsia sp. 1001216sp1]MDB8819618.1 potassium-transporting ATPase subunit KdpC [Romboutsia sp. 1001216sp
MEYIKKASLIFIIMTVITGILYPVTVTAFAQIFVPYKANGSIIKEDGKSIGSEILGQNFTSPDYFWSRPSATSDYPYNGLSSAGSNMSPTGEDFEKVIDERVKLYKKYEENSDKKIPVDLVTASGSGLDPHISLKGAIYQVDRIAKYSKVSKEKLLELIDNNTEKKFMGIFGEDKVNVLNLNLDLEKIK